MPRTASTAPSKRTFLSNPPAVDDAATAHRPATENGPSTADDPSAREGRVRHVYVIRLDEAVLARRRFREANPGYEEGRPCYYVGVTGRDPDTRFHQHRKGYRASRIVRRFGRWIARRKCVRLEGATSREAERAERAVAARLRRRGFGIWQN